MISFKNLTKGIGKIGEGSQATVEKHQIIGTQNFVAIKTYTSNRSIDISILRELNAFQKLKDCQSIVQWIDIDFKLSGKGLLVQFMMPLYKQDLYDFMTHTSTRQRIQMVETYLNQMFAALTTLYYRGIVHSDIKPANILLDYEDNLVLADFGLSTQMGCDFNLRGYQIKIANGSPIFLAPEILVSNTYYSTKGDLWSLAITFIQYLTLDEITYPPQQLVNDYGDFKSIVFQILSLLTQPLDDSQINYNLVKQNAILDGIDVPFILQTLIPNEYHEVPTKVIQQLSSMLRMDPTLRPEITQLVTYDICDIHVPMIERGAIHDKSIIQPRDVFQLINTVIRVSKQLHFQPTTCYLAIDLLERYFHNYIIADVKYLNVIAATIMLSIRKLNETKYTSMENLIMAFKHLFSMALFVQSQFAILHKFHYLLTTCETDDFVLVLNEYKTTLLQTVDPLLDEEDQLDVVNNQMYNVLMKTYSSMQQKGEYSGDTFTFDLIDYFNQSI